MLKIRFWVFIGICSILAGAHCACVDNSICSTLPNVCSSSDQNLAKTLCPAKCGFCGCADAPQVNCSRVAPDLCTFDAAVFLCRKTCNLCQKDTSTVTCQDSVVGIQCKDLPDPCSDTVGIVSCPQFCGLCPSTTPPPTTANAPTTKSTTTKPTTTQQTTTTTTTQTPTTTKLPQTTTKATAPPVPTTIVRTTTTTTTKAPAPSACSTNPCLHGGSCIPNGDTSFTCYCPGGGYTGLFCQVPPNQNVAVTTKAPSGHGNHDLHTTAKPKNTPHPSFTIRPPNTPSPPFAPFPPNTPSPPNSPSNHHGTINFDTFCRDNTGMYKDPTSCHYYMECSSGMAYRLPCGDGTVFHASETVPNWGFCDFPKNTPGCH